MLFLDRNRIRREGLRKLKTENNSRRVLPSKKPLADSRNLVLSSDAQNLCDKYISSLDPTIHTVRAPIYQDNLFDSEYSTPNFLLSSIKKKIK